MQIKWNGNIILVIIILFSFYSMFFQDIHPSPLWLRYAISSLAALYLLCEYTKRWKNLNRMDVMDIAIWIAVFGVILPTFIFGYVVCAVLFFSGMILIEWRHGSKRQSAFLREETLILIKPDAIKKELIGEIISRFEKIGNIADIKVYQKCPKWLLEEHYKEHKGRDYYDRLINFMKDQQIIAIVLNGQCYAPGDTIIAARQIAGPTKNAPSGTIRGDYGAIDEKTLVHTSDSVNSAKREIGLWFREGDNQ